MISESFDEIVPSLSLEIGNALSERFVGSLRAASNDDITRCKILYFELGYAWAPVIRGWAEWAGQNAKYPPCIILRDAKPLSVVAPSDEWPRVWLNRVICGIRDELSGDPYRQGDPMLGRYIQEMGLDRPFTLVDTGCWGTVVKYLAQQLGLRFQPLFFYSHNPLIPGYLNTFDIGDETEEALNDSLECCFLNSYSRPRRLIIQNGSVVPEIEYLDGLLAEFGLAAMEGLRQGGSDSLLNGRQGLDKLLLLHERAKEGRFSGVLPVHSSTWSEGERFLREWESNPPDLLD